MATDSSHVYLEVDGWLCLSMSRSTYTVLQACRRALGVATELVVDGKSATSLSSALVQHIDAIANALVVEQQAITAP